MLINKELTNKYYESYIPLLDTDEEYFLISFGPISMNCAYVYNRHFTFNDKVQIIKKAIDEVDPMGLLVMHCPKDEYIQEAQLLLSKLKLRKPIL